jgi:hypothetical protein
MIKIYYGRAHGSSSEIEVLIIDRITSYYLAIINKSEVTTYKQGYFIMMITITDAEASTITTNVNIVKSKK